MTDPGAAPPARIRPLAESALLIELGDAITPAATARVLAATAALDTAALPGVIDRIPGYTTLTVVLDPLATDQDTMVAALEQVLAAPTAAAPPPSRLVTIPVAYGGEHGPDLGDVAAASRLSPAEVIARHAGAEYAVACVGFVPGFAYLVGLPPELATPRLASPRTRVPVGSVGIGGAQTGVYSLPTPGGWRLIGRTPLRPFVPNRPEPFLLQTGDRVHFEPITAAEYDARTAEIADDQ